MTIPRPLGEGSPLSAAEIEEAVDSARDFLRRGGPAVFNARDVALALVQIAGGCSVGAPCERHEGAVHGKEAEELRAGVEQILRNTSVVRDEDASFVLAELRRSLIFLLDRVDARDSLAFREATDPPDGEAAIAP